jgi:hypothetical protein
MHLTLKREATKPAAANVLQQQARFDTFFAGQNVGVTLVGEARLSRHPSCVTI